MDVKRAKIEEFKRIAKFEKDLQREIANVLPSVYACICKALYERGMDPDDIADVVARTEVIWGEQVDNCQSMIEWVAETTGIELRSDSWLGYGK